MILKPMDVTPEVVDALVRLRQFASGPTLPGSIREAINTLDDVGVFAVIDEVTGYDVDHERPVLPDSETEDPFETETACDGGPADQCIYGSGATHVCK